MKFFKRLLFRCFKTKKTRFSAFISKQADVIYLKYGGMAELHLSP